MNRLGTEPYAGWCGETGVNRPLLPVEIILLAVRFSVFKLSPFALDSEMIGS